MSEEEKLKWMFEQVHGETTGNCGLYVNDSGREVSVDLMKNGAVCWSRTKSELVFEFLTKHLD